MKEFILKNKANKTKTETLQQAYCMGMQPAGCEFDMLVIDILVWGLFGCHVPLPALEEAGRGGGS